MKRDILTLAILLSTTCFLLGCSSQSPSANTGGDSAADGHDGDGHDHDGDEHAGHNHNAPGPNGGHVIVLGEEAYHAEWMHDDDTGTVTVVLLDKEIQQEVQTVAESIAIEIKLGENAPKRYELPAVNPTGDETPKASRFELAEPALVTGLQIGEGVTATLVAEIDGRSFTGPIEHHAHDEHAHDGHAH